MKRRGFIKYAGFSAGVGLTGCIRQGSEPGNDTDGNGTDASDPGSDDNTEVSLTNTDFELVGSVDGEAGNATVEFNTDENSVRIEGVIVGNNGCYTARLGSAEYDCDEDVLVIDVESFEDREEDEACTEALINLGYGVSAEFSGGLPSSVEVRHDGERVTKGERGTNTEVDGGIESTDFRVVGSRNTDSENVDDAEIEFDEESGSVVFEGTIRGSDGCKTAALESAEYDGDEDKVSLSVVTRNREDANRRMCTEALVEIDYIATVNFDGEIPHNASVSHDKRATIGASYASDSASARPEPE